MTFPKLTPNSQMSFQELPNELQDFILKLSREPPTFDQWMESINTILMETHQIEVGDLPDQPFVDYHEEGLEPQDVVNIMLEDEFFF